MADHAWCQDTARDAAVRAAEDKRTGPLPTLEECIEGQKQLQTARPCGGTDPAPSRGERGAADTCMQAERVTLEITHDGKHGPVLTWPFECGSYGKGVRVVEEAHFDDLAQVAMERDAAIRERDAAVAESERRLRLCETMKRDGDSARFHAAVAQARVAELEAASGGGEQPRGWLTEEEREAVQWAADAAYDKQHPAEDTLRNILARSTPPEVVLPVADCSWCSDYATVWRECLEAVRSSLAAAGVAVKEVGDE